MDQAAPASSGTIRSAAMRFELLVALGCAVVVLVAGRSALGWGITHLVAAPLVGLAVAALFILPGLALLRLLWVGELAPAERWPLAIGLSCACIPLLLLASLPLGIHWNGPLCWAGILACGLVAAWPRRYSTRTERMAGLHAWLAWPNLLLVAITFAAIAARLYPTRDLPAGMFGDSYHHTIIAQLLVDHGGLFSSWQPYAPLRTFTYHFGFHSMIAWLNWLGGVPVIHGLLVIGQVQSALVVPLTYLFTRRVLANERIALWAALLVGFASVMPAYYVNWGRYTQLAGQMVLPAVCVCWVALLEPREQEHTPFRWQSVIGERWRLVVLAGGATAGLALNHYRVAVFAGCFVLAYTGFLLLSRVRSWPVFIGLALRGVLAAGLALVLFLPWLIRLREGTLLRLGQYYMAQNIGSDDTNQLPTLQDFLGLNAGHYLLPLAALGLALLLVARRWRALIIVAWAGLVWLAANPYLIGLNGAGIISNFAVAIAVYAVLVPLGGAVPGMVFEWLERLPGAGRVALAAQTLAAALLVAWGLRWQEQVVDTRNLLLTPADVAAMHWISSETPPDAHFFVNAFGAYGDTIYVGSDGGWWLPFLTGRTSNVPPISEGQEAGEQPDYQMSVTNQNRTLMRNNVWSRKAADALRAAGYSYLYDGPTDTAPTKEYVDPAALARSQWFEQVYSHDGVTIWKVR